MSKNFLNLYWRNVQGTFGFVNNFIKDENARDINRYAAFDAFAYILHLALLPITLTFGAGIKTIIDYFSRESSYSDSQLQECLATVDQIDEKQIDIFLEDISKYNAHSKSSKELLRTLKTASKTAELSLSSRVLDKRQELIQSEIDQCVEEKFKEFFDENMLFQKFPLNEKSTTDITLFTIKTQAEIMDKKVVLQKQALNNYISAEHNQGKKLREKILGFFSSSTSHDFSADSALPYNETLRVV